jgi:ribosomal protein L37E
MELKTIMTDKFKVKARIARGDGSVAPYTLSKEDVRKGDPKHLSGDTPAEPHDRESEVITSIRNEKLICPRCGKPTIHVEFPDHYEAWTKCSECGFFMGMSNEEFHRMENSPNINEKIKKMAIKKDLVKPYP